MQTICFVLLCCIISLVISSIPNTHRQSAIRIAKNGINIVPSQIDLNEFKLIGTPYMTMKGTQKQKAQQHCNNIPVYGACIVIESNEDGSNPVPFSGVFYKCNDIELDLLQKSNNIIHSDKAIQSVITPRDKSTILSSKTKLNIYFDPTNGQEYLAYIINVAGNDYAWFAIVDANSGRLLLKINNIQGIRVNEIGGNVRFGPIMHEFDVPYYPELRNDRVVIKNHNNSDFRFPGAKIIECKSTADCVDDEVNGGFGPAGDAFKFGNDVFDLYRDWGFGTTPVDPALIPIPIHVNWIFDSAYWDGFRVYLGNGGARYFHPLTSLEAVAHELGHAFTEYTSGIIYHGDNGGLGEAYSDLAGEAAKAYVRGHNDWRVRFGLINETRFPGRTSWRYMYDPPIADDGGLDAWTPEISTLSLRYSRHKTSGVYNKFFYLLYSYGWSTKQIFQIATKANQIYWLPSENMHHAACDIMNAAIDLYGENQILQTDIKQAFKVVNIACIDEPVVVETHKGLSVDSENPLFGDYDNTDTMGIQIFVVGPNGDVDLRVRFNEPPTIDPEVWDCGSGWSYSREVCDFAISQIGTYYWRLDVNPGKPTVTDLDLTITKYKLPEASDFEEFKQCTFSPLDIEDVGVWSSTIYNNGHPWLVTRNEDKLWISSYELSSRTIEIEYNKFCAVSNPRFISITTRAAGRAPNYDDNYRLVVEGKDADGNIIDTFDTGFVKTKPYFEKYRVSFDNTAGKIVNITITEFGQDIENDVRGYFGTALKLPIIEISADPIFIPKCDDQSHCFRSQITRLNCKPCLFKVCMIYTPENERCVKDVIHPIDHICTTPGGATNICQGNEGNDEFCCKNCVANNPFAPSSYLCKDTGIGNIDTCGGMIDCQIVGPDEEVIFGIKDGNGGCGGCSIKDTLGNEFYEDWTCQPAPNNGNICAGGDQEECQWSIKIPERYCNVPTTNRHSL